MDASSANAGWSRLMNCCAGGGRAGAHQRQFDGTVRDDRAETGRAGGDTVVLTVDAALQKRANRFCSNQNVARDESPPRPGQECRAEAAVKS